MTTQSPTAASTRRPLGLIGNPYLLLALTSLFWSGNHVIGRAIGGHVPSFTISTLRWILPSLLLWVFAQRIITRDWKVIKANWKILLWLGITGGSVFTSLQYLGLRYTSALNVSVLNSLAPIMIIAVADVVFRDRVTRLQLTGIITSSLGVGVIVAHGEFETLMRLSFNWGDLIIVFNMLVFAVYATYLRQRPQIHPLSFLFVFGVISALGTLPFAIWEAVSGYALKADWITAGATLYVALFPGFLAYLFWNRGVELIGANRAGPYLHLIPVYTAIIATTMLGEQLHPFHVAGFALIIGGVWLASRKGPGAAYAAPNSGTE